VLAVSAGAAAGLTQYNSTIIFPNGWNFSRAALSAAPARELTSIPQPRIVVISYLTSLLDYQLLGRIATEVTASLVILGRRHGKLSSNDERCFGALAQLKNVYLLGGRPTTELPSYIIGADVCLAPYKLSDRNYEIDPLKVYQYLALGKPVVSRPVKALEAIEDLVVCASDEDSFVQAVRAALDAPCTLSAKERRRSFASATTWDRRWSNLADALGDDPEMQQFVRRYVGTPNRDGG
jgi:glycosyltransferase involved in cell wall biosynthesis